MSTQNLHGLGEGVYPSREATPWPAHPNTLSFVEMVFVEEVSAQDKAGKETSLQALQRLAPETRAGALGQTKAAYFDQGLLRTGMIRAPLYAVDARLARQGKHNADMANFKQPAAGADPYDPTAPRNQPNVATPARAASVAVENQIRAQRDFETGVFVDATGRELARFHGEPDQVSIPASWLATMKGNTFTHNHPGGMSFSVDDIDLAARYKLAEVRAVTANFRHAATGLDGVWHGAVGAAYDESVGALRERVTAMVRNDEISAANFTAELKHLAWVLTAKKLGFTYSRERS